MAEPFSFGFGDDDIEEDGFESNLVVIKDLDEQAMMADGRAVRQPKTHTLEEMLTHHPSSIAFSSHQIPSGSASVGQLCLPRRELFDIRAQLMAEQDMTGAEDDRSAELSSDDIAPGIYEGGFKTWECAMDLAMYSTSLIADGFLDMSDGDVHVIELGAGTALPTASLLHHLLNPFRPTGSAHQIHLTIADYNAHVLTLATIPNLLLAFASALPDRQPWPFSGDLELSPELLQSFIKTLRDRNITISGISGSWGEAFVDVFTSELQHDTEDRPAGSGHAKTILIMGSETIYSPSSLRIFAQTVLSLISYSTRKRCRSLALVGAKLVYFGVGGGVDEFVAVVEGMGGYARHVWESSGVGVGRCILEIGIC